VSTYPERIVCLTEETTETPAVVNGRIYETPSTYILQPGPAALTEGVRRIHRHLASMYSQ
jgi:hypothetical protein